MSATTHRNPSRWWIIRLLIETVVVFAVLYLAAVALGGAGVVELTVVVVVAVAYAVVRGIRLRGAQPD